MCKKLKISKKFRNYVDDLIQKNNLNICRILAQQYNLLKIYALDVFMIYAIQRSFLAG